MTSQPLAARTRLDGALTLWRRALDEYFDVDAFVVSLNALIQALRTVTWVLQKDLRHHQGFDVWYDAQQQSMRGDAVMRWLKDARNHIEKQGDLDLTSTARISVVDSWLTAPHLELDIPPLVTPADLAVLVGSLALPDRLRAEGYLRVERRWETASIPGYELLDACAHGYLALDAIVAEAEVRFGDAPHATVESRPMPDGLVPAIDQRTAYLELATGELADVAKYRVRRDDDTVAAVEAHYGSNLVGPPPIADDVESLARWHHSIGRRMLEVDGHHVTFALAFRDGRQVGITALAARSHEEKYLLMESVAKDVLVTRADRVVITGEAWIAPEVQDDGPPPSPRAADREDRMEALVTYGAGSGGVTVIIASRFQRVDGKVELSPAAALAGDPQILAPILRVWEKAPRDDPSQ